MTATPEQIAQKWATNLGGASQAIKDGVAAVRTAPGQAAAAQKQVWAANVAAAQDKWARRVASVSLQDWQSAMTDKGINRIASGATAAQGKFGAFMGQGDAGAHRRTRLGYTRRGCRGGPDIIEARALGCLQCRH